MNTLEVDNKSSKNFENLPPKDLQKICLWVFTHFSPQVLLHDARYQSNSPYSILFVRKGSFRFTIDGKTSQVKHNSLITVSPDSKVEFSDFSDDIHISAIIMRRPMVNEIREQIQRYCGDIPYIIKPIEVLNPRFVPFIENLYSRMFAQQCNIMTPFYTVSAMYELLHFYFTVGLRAFGTVPLISGDEASMAISRKFLDLIYEHHRSEHFLGFYADKIGVSAKHLSRMVKSHTGISAAAWIEKYLLVDAKVLLRTTNIPVKVIAKALNFSSQSFFGKFFRKHTGISPRDFRKNPD